jgi:hypothetical protein
VGHGDQGRPPQDRVARDPHARVLSGVRGDPVKVRDDRRLTTYLGRSSQVHSPASMTARSLNLTSRSTTGCQEANGAHTRKPAARAADPCISLVVCPVPVMGKIRSLYVRR